MRIQEMMVIQMLLVLVVAVKITTFSRNDLFIRSRLLMFIQVVASQGSHFKIGFIVAAVHVLPAVTLGQYLGLCRHALRVVRGLLEEIVVV